MPRLLVRLGRPYDVDSQAAEVVLPDGFTGQVQLNFVAGRLVLPARARVTAPVGITVIQGAPRAGSHDGARAQDRRP